MTFVAVAVAVRTLGTSVWERSQKGRSTKRVERDVRAWTCRKKRKNKEMLAVCTDEYPVCDAAELDVQDPRDDG